MPAKSISSVEGTDLQYGTDLVLEYLQTFGRGQGQHPPDEREVDPVFVIGSGLVGHHSEPPSPPLRSVRRRSRVSAIRSSARMFSPSRSDLAHNCLTLARSSIAGAQRLDLDAQDFLPGVELSSTFGGLLVQ